MYYTGVSFTDPYYSALAQLTGDEDDDTLKNHSDQLSLDSIEVRNAVVMLLLPLCMSDAHHHHTSTTLYFFALSSISTRIKKRN